MSVLSPCPYCDSQPTLRKEADGSWVAFCACQYCRGENVCGRVRIARSTKKSVLKGWEEIVEWEKQSIVQHSKR